MPTLLDTTPDAPRVDDAAAHKRSLIGLDRADLAACLAEAGVPERQTKMRVQQLWSWLYARGATDFDDMSDVSKTLRATLAERFSVARPEIVSEQISSDGTRKWLMRLESRNARDGRGPEVETVYIPDDDRGTLCVSSQVGCTLTCSFCHTGTQALVRNLDFAMTVLPAANAAESCPVKMA
ncbi:MAG: hypothetical protein AAFO62_01685, partial [Pseudomonadota bacterium]